MCLFLPFFWSLVYHAPAFQGPINEELPMASGEREVIQWSWWELSFHGQFLVSCHFSERGNKILRSFAEIVKACLFKGLPLFPTCPLSPCLSLLNICRMLQHLLVRSPYAFSCFWNSVRQQGVFALKILLMFCLFSPFISSFLDHYLKGNGKKKEKMKV